MDMFFNIILDRSPIEIRLIDIVFSIAFHCSLPFYSINEATSQRVCYIFEKVAVYYFILSNLI